MGILKKINRSFAARLSFYVVIFSAIIFVVNISVFYIFSAKTIENNAKIKVDQSLEIINLKIENVLRVVEAAPNNLKWIIGRGLLQSPDSAYSFTRRVIANNPIIYGSAIAFEPNYFQEKGRYFSPYSHRDGDSIRTLQLGTDTYDYFTWDWYATPKALGQPCWSEPYYDEGGGQMMMCTYSAPIYTPDKRFIGVFTADISLEWLTDMLNKMTINDRSYTFMIGKDGRYIAHYLKERILNQTIFGATQEMTDPAVRRLGEQMIAGEKGVEVLDNDGVKSYVYFAPVSHTHWSVATVIPAAEVFADLYRINFILITIIVIGLILLFFICWRTIHQQANPLKKFADTARVIAKGDFNAQLPEIRSQDEMKELADSFGYMQHELTNYIADLKQTTSVKEKIESELRIARDIQMGMIPKIFPPFPSRRELDLYAILKPAKEVGGDLFDFFMEGDDLYFTIGDVSGKGVPASLFMAVTRSLFRSVSTNTHSPSKIVMALNASISESNDSNMFVTLFVGVLNLITGELKYCNAGHNPPILIAPEEEAKYVQIPPNVPVGVVEGFPYKEQSTCLKDGTTLVLYTDGVTEAENREQELYGESRFLQVVEEARAASSRSIIDYIVKELDTHVKENLPSDDITMLVLKYDKERTSRIRETLVINGHVEQLKVMAEFVERVGEKMSLSPALVMNMNLVLEEAVSNVMLYAYNNDKEKSIEINIEREEDLLILTITDSGSEFDPTLKEDPDVTLSAEERQIGGLGIFLIKKIMNEVEYQRVRDNNVLTMKKKIIN